MRKTQKSIIADFLAGIARILSFKGYSRRHGNDSRKTRQTRQTRRTSLWSVKVANPVHASFKWQGDKVIEVSYVFDSAEYVANMGPVN